MCTEIDKTFVDYIAAIAPSVIAAIAVVIASQQWFTNRNNLKNQLFERRIIIYQHITHFIGHILTGDPNKNREEHMRFLIATKDAYFLFGNDIKLFVKEIQDKSNKLQKLERERTAPSPKMNSESTDNKDELEINNWFKSTMNNIEEKFEKYLKLSH